MTKKLALSIALLLATRCLTLHAQSSPGTDPGSAQQSSTTDCSDPLNASTDACMQGQDQQGGTSSLRDQLGAGSGTSLGTSSADNLSTSGQNRSMAQLLLRMIPPDQPTEFQKFVAATVGQLLPVYGANLFRTVPSTFAPTDVAPVTADYVIGPDDILRIRIWGQISFSGNVKVDRSGNVYLPQVGSIPVAGIQYSALDQTLRSAVSRIYRNFDLSVDVGKVRAMQVYVAGRARRPGAYTVSSLSSLVDALFTSGGPAPQGSLRHIQLKRDGKVVTDFDLYALLIHGDKSKDVRLLPEDVLYIPPVGPQVAIAGSVGNPGIYELREGEAIANLLDDAGNTSTIASNARISLERTSERQVRQAMEFAVDATGLATPLTDGDILRVFPIVPAYRKTVTLRGDVANPGRFGWHEGMHLSDLIPDKDSLLSRDYWWKRAQLGLPGPEFEPIIAGLGKRARICPPRPRSTNNAAGTQPQTSNQVSQQQLQQQSSASILTAPEPGYGEQDIPGYTNQAIPGYGSTEAQGCPSYSNRDNGQGGSGSGQDASGGDDTQQDAVDSNGDPLDPGSQERSRSGGSLASQSNRTPLPGGAGQPRKNDVRLAAPDINWDYAVIERLDPNNFKTSLVPFDLGKLVLERDASQNIELQAGDTITVFSHADIRVPLDQQTKYVHLEGEFVHSGIYSVQPGETLRDLVRRAGGLTTKAYLYGSEFTRESTRLLQQQRLDEYVRTVDLEAERGTLALTASAITTSPNTNAAIDATRELVTQLKQIRATGRVVLDVHPASAGLGDVPAIGLEDGDRFTVPSAPATINVVGAVYDQNSFIYRPGSLTATYMKKAGGPERDADWKHSFVIRADGSVISRTSESKSLWTANGFDQLRLYPGDTIVVPEKTLRPTALRGLLDWSNIFGQLALGAAAIQVLK